MFSKTARIRIRQFHRWAGVFIGIQLMFWISSGVYFAWMPIKVVKDEDRTRDIPYEPLPLKNTVAPSSLNFPEGYKPKAVRLENTPAGVLYRVESFQGETTVFNALTGDPAQHLSSELASELAIKQIQSEAAPTKVELLRDAPSEYKGPLPVFRISLGDFRKTHLYSDPWTGKIIAKRNMFWRLYDFLWMLHIMDFKEREEFNNPWLRSLSLGALVFAISGYVLFQFGKPPRRNQKTQQSI